MQGNSRTKNSIKNIMGGVFFRVVGIVYSFAIKTIIVWTLGKTYLGLNSLFSSIITVLSLSELGIGTAMVYNMYKPVADENYELLSALLNTYRKLYRIIGTVILSIGLVILPFLKNFISGTYPKDINIYILFLIYLLDTVLSYFLFAYKGALLEAHQQNRIENMIHSATNILMYTGQIILLLITHNYYYYIIVAPICTLILNLVRNRTVNRLYPNIVCEGKLEKEYLYSIFRKVKALIGHKLGTIIIVSADSIVISSFLGLDVLGIYSNYYLIINSLIAFITIFYTSITASVGNSIVASNKSTIEKNFKELNFMNFWLVAWCTVCLFCLYQPFMKIWMGKDMLFPNHMVILFAIYFFCWLIRRIGLTYKDAGGLWEQDFWKPYVGAVINLITNIILVKVIGVEGVLLSTIAVMVFIYFPWETAVIFKCFFKKSPVSYLRKMFCYAMATVIACSITYYISHLINDGGIAHLLLKAIICVIVPNCLFAILFLKTEEMKAVLDRIKK